MVVWLIPTLLTVHNAEEAVMFRSMRMKLPVLLPEPFATMESRLSPDALTDALIGLSVLAFLLAALVLALPRMRGVLWLLLALEAAVAINVIAHLLSAAFLFRGYGPGLVTALLINAPFAWYVLRKARDESWISRSAWRTLLVGGLVLHGPVLIGALWLVGTLTGR